MFVISSTKSKAHGWQQDHANARGLPSGAYVRAVKQHPYDDQWAYLIKSEEETEPWAVDAQSEAEETVPELDSGWYRGQTAPAAALYDESEFYTTDPGVTSVDGQTGDINTEALLGNASASANYVQEWVMEGQTTDATPLVLQANDWKDVEPGAIWHTRTRVMARTEHNDRAVWTVRAVWLASSGSSPAVSLLGMPVTQGVHVPAGFSGGHVEAHSWQGDYPTVKVTGLPSTTVKWKAQMKITELLSM
jgi:hypothetical protein